MYKGKILYVREVGTRTLQMEDREDTYCITVVNSNLHRWCISACHLLVYHIFRVNRKCMNLLRAVLASANICIFRSGVEFLQNWQKFGKHKIKLAVVYIFPSFVLELQTMD